MYITEAGDTWDIIAYNVLGDEKRINEILDLNTKYIDTVIFEAGIMIQIPENIKTEKIFSSWRNWWEQDKHIIK